jgi:hypothetical protein
MSNNPSDKNWSLQGELKKRKTQEIDREIEKRKTQGGSTSPASPASPSEIKRATGSAAVSPEIKRTTGSVSSVSDIKRATGTIEPLKRSTGSVPVTPLAQAAPPKRTTQSAQIAPSLGDAVKRATSSLSAVAPAGAVADAAAQMKPQSKRMAVIALVGVVTMLLCIGSLTVFSAVVPSSTSAGMVVTLHGTSFTIVEPTLDMSKLPVLTAQDLVAKLKPLMDVSDVSTLPVPNEKWHAQQEYGFTMSDGTQSAQVYVLSYDPGAKPDYMGLDMFLLGQGRAPYDSFKGWRNTTISNLTILSSTKSDALWNELMSHIKSMTIAKIIPHYPTVTPNVTATTAPTDTAAATATAAPK